MKIMLRLIIKEQYYKMLFSKETSNLIYLALLIIYILTTSIVKVVVLDFVDYNRSERSL